MSFILSRHGFRSTNSTTPQQNLIIGPTVEPSIVKMPSFGGSFAENLLGSSLSHTLPKIVSTSVRIVSKKSVNLGTYADSSVSRCQQTAAGWAYYGRSSSVCGVPSEPDHPTDPRVNHRAAEVALNTERWIVEQKLAADHFRDIVQKQWSRLLNLLGFTQTNVASTDSTSVGPVSVDGKARALEFLGLPPNTFLFATTVIMSFGVVGKTSPQILKEAGWPISKNTNHRRPRRPRSWFHAASRLLATILAVWYPKGYVADTMSTAVSRLALEHLRNGKTNGMSPNLFQACSHEEHASFWYIALGLGETYYANPTSCILLKPQKDNRQLDIYVIKNKIRSAGYVSRKVKTIFVGTIPTTRLEILAGQEIPPLPEPICVSTYGNSQPW